MNDNYKRAPWADILYGCDPVWWEWHFKDHRAELEAFKGRKITQDEATAKKYELEWIRSIREDGLSRDKEIIHQGKNSGYQAINLAYNEGAERIILIGYDMQFTNAQAHWFGDHPNKVRSDYNDFMLEFNRLAEHIKGINLEIINATQQTAMTCFPIAKLEDVLC